MALGSKLLAKLTPAKALVRRHRWFSLVLTVVVFVPLLALLVWGMQRAVHYNEVLPGVWVNEYVASGLTEQELKQDLKATAARLNQRPVSVHLEGAVFHVQPSELAAKVDVAATAAAAFAAGRAPGFFRQFSWWLQRLGASERVEFVVNFDKSKLEGLVTQWERSAISDPPVPGDVRGQGERLVMEAPRPGRRIDRERLIHDLGVTLGRSNERVLALTTRKVKPALQRQDVERALKYGQALVSAPLSLVSNDGRLNLGFTREELVRAIATRPVPNAHRLEVFFDTSVIDTSIQHDRERLEAAPKDASFRVDRDNKISIVPGRPGTKLDAAAIAEALLLAAHSPGHVGQLPVDRDAQPQFSTEDARALNIVRLVARFSTRHACCQPRVQNIHRIADILDGTVVKPGEVFSINEKVGPRTKANGFVPAPTIVEGDMEDTVGGGVSQFATTIFNALFYGGYDIIERQPHSYWFTRYPMGHEATLSYPKPDIIFKNDTHSGLLIKTEYSETRITVKLYGDNEGRKVKATVSPRQDIVDPPVELVPDPSVEPDEEKVLNSGMIGWSVIAGRIITFKDKTQKVEKRKVTYMPRVRRIRVHPCRIPEGEEGYTGQDCPEPEDVEMEDPDSDKEAPTAPGASDPEASAEID